MPEPIASLRLEHAAQLPGFVESWRNAALATTRIDPATARRAVRELYRACGLRGPRAVICLDSPIACLMARAMLVTLLRDTQRPFPSFYVSFYDRNLYKQLCKDLDERFSTQVWHATWGQLQEQIGEPQYRPLAAQFGDLGGEQLHSDQLYSDLKFAVSVGYHLWDQITPELQEDLVELLAAALSETGSQVRDPIDTQIRDHFRRNIDPRHEHRPDAFLRRELAFNGWQRPCLIGGQETSWLALYDFVEHIGGQYDAESKRLLEAYKDYARNCGWLYAFRSVAFVSDRPREIHLDAQRRLHHETGAAVRYCDGWGAHVWHGTAVPSWLIEGRSTITPRMIDQLPYAQVRQAALEIFGFNRYLAAREANVIAADELQGQPRRLLEVFVSGYPFRIIEVVNGTRERDGTRRKFHLAAMPGNTPAEVIAASYGIALAHYREAVRT